MQKYAKPGRVSPERAWQCACRRHHATPSCPVAMPHRAGTPASCTALLLLAGICATGSCARHRQQQFPRHGSADEGDSVRKPTCCMIKQQLCWKAALLTLYNLSWNMISTTAKYHSQCAFKHLEDIVFFSKELFARLLRKFPSLCNGHCIDIRGLTQQ